MEAILIGLALTAIVVFSILLGVLVAGIRREEHATSLTCQVPGLSAAITRRVLGVYTRTSSASDERCDHPDCGMSPTPGGRA
jgi:hypothetical protein